MSKVPSPYFACSIIPQRTVTTSQNPVLSVHGSILRQASPVNTSDGPEFNSQQCWIECQPCIRIWKLRILFGNCSITIVRLAPCGVLFGPGGSVPGGRVSTVSSPGGPEAGRLEGSLRGSSGLRWSQQNSQPLTKSGKN